MISPGMLSESLYTLSGCHADIGGGSHPSTIPDSLSSIPLRWMISQCQEKVPEISFDREYLRSIGIEHGPKVTVAPLPSLALDESRFKTFVQALKTLGDGRQIAVLDHIKDELDSTEAVYNQLHAKIAWWVLELIPMLTTYQDEKGDWIRQRMCV